MKDVRMPLVVLVLAALACGQTPSATPTPQPTPVPQPTAISRQSAIPAVEKMTPADDAHPPVIAPGWSQPIPLGQPINTAGGEDSPFVTPDG
mgnify:CR=1 FL=1